MAGKTGWWTSHVGTERREYNLIGVEMARGRASTFQEQRADDNLHDRRTNQAQDLGKTAKISDNSRHSYTRRNSQNRRFRELTPICSHTRVTIFY